MSVKHAPRDGSLMKKKYVFQSVIFVLLGIKKLEIVLNVTSDLLFKMENVLLKLIKLYHKAIFFAKFGLKKFVLNVHQEVSSMKMDFVSQLVLNVVLLIRLQEIVLCVLMDMIYSMENVNFLNLIMPVQLI